MNAKLFLTFLNRYFSFDTNTEIIANFDQIWLKKILKSFKIIRNQKYSADR